MNARLATRKLTFDEPTHTYRLDGAVVPSVTQILEPIRRELGGYEDVLEYKRSIGKALDLAIELHEKNDLDFATLDPAVVPFFEAWLKPSSASPGSGCSSISRRLLAQAALRRHAGRDRHARPDVKPGRADRHEMRLDDRPGDGDPDRRLRPRRA
jgi:hypothetical protein